MSENQYEPSNSNHVHECGCKKILGKGFFSKTLWITMCFIFALFTLNKIHQWHTTKQIYNVIESMTVDSDNSEFVSINYRGNHINKHMLLSIILKQQSMILAHQKYMEEQLIKLIGTSNTDNNLSSKKLSSTNYNDAMNVKNKHILTHK